MRKIISLGPLFLLLLFLDGHRCQDKCQAFINSLDSQYPDFNSSLTPQQNFYLDYSGRRGYRDIGQMELCKKLPDMKFYVILLLGRDYLDSKSKDGSGVCLISECTKESLKSDHNLLRKLFKLNNWQISDDARIDIYDPEEELPKTFGFYFAVTLHFSLFALAVVSTIIVQTGASKYMNKGGMNQFIRDDKPLLTVPKDYEAQTKKESPEIELITPDNNGKVNQIQGDQKDTSNASRSDENPQSASNEDSELGRNKVGDNPYKDPQWMKDKGIRSVAITSDESPQFQAYGTLKNQPIRSIESMRHKNHWLFEAFDLKSGVKSLWQTAKEQKQNEDIAVYGFLRVIGIWWVLAVHSTAYPADATRDISYRYSGFSLLLTQGSYGVEYFYYMSGFLAIYILIPKLKKEGLTFTKFLEHNKHRWIRIWPHTMMALILYWLIIPYVFQSPLWARYTGAAAYCDKYWWQKPLIIDNLIPQESGSCMAWTWYVAVDLQAFPLLILIAFLYTKSSTLGYTVTLLFVVQSTITAAYQGFKYQFDFSHYYAFSPARWGEIFIGVLFGIHYYEYAKLNSQSNLYSYCINNPRIKYGIFIAGLFLDLFVAILKIQLEIPFGDAGDWLLWSKIIMVIATGLVFAPIITKEASALKNFLNWRIWQVLAKLSFGLYLHNVPVILVIVLNKSAYAEELSLGIFIKTTLLCMAGCYAISMVYYLLVEKPTVAIEQHFTKKALNARRETK